MTTADRPSLRQLLALNRTVGIVLLTVLLFGLGEELWSSFMPAYLKALDKNGPQEITWKTLWVVGLYGCLRNLFEGFCYIAGGRLTATLGDRGSLMLFAVLTISGYVLFLTVPATWAAVAAALSILGWEPLSVPVTFTTVGATVEDKKRGMAFALQSIQKRLPKIIGPAIAGVVLQFVGEINGTRLLLALSLVLAVVSLLVQWRWMPHRKPPPDATSSWAILHGLHPSLRRLLIAEVFTRWCDWLVRDFVVLYLLVVLQEPKWYIGLLFSIQHFTALMTYLPIGRLTQQVGLQPFIGLTFVFFALFPLALYLCPGGWWLIGAFVVYGLREIGEPARKALITSLMAEETRARGVGLYWGTRSFAMCSASVVGAWIWEMRGPEWLLLIAFGVGCVGAAIYWTLCAKR